MRMPNRPKIFTVIVDGEQWRKTSSFDNATRTDKVYILDETRGAVVFGNGEHGQQPRSGAEVLITYVAQSADAGNTRVSLTIKWPPTLCEVLVAVDKHSIHFSRLDPGVEQSSGDKRVRYFSGQMLSAEDLETEQQYNLRARNRHNKMLHGPGIVTGLGVEVSSGSSTPTVIVEPGYAIDREGHELIVDSCVELEIREEAAFYYVTIQHAEKQTDWRPAGDSSKPVASRIEDGVRIRLTVDDQSRMSLAIGKLVHAPPGWELDRKFQPVRSR